MLFVYYARAALHSAFFKAVFALLVALAFKAIVLSCLIQWTYGLLAITLIFDAFAYARLARGKRFQFSAAYIWAVFGTLAVDMALVVESMKWLRKEVSAGERFKVALVPISHVLHSLCIVHVNSFCYPYLAKRSHGTLLVMDVLEVVDISQAFYQYVTFSGSSGMDRTFLWIASLNYLLFWLGSKALSLPIVINIDSAHHLTIAQQAKAARYLEALTLFCDVITDTPYLIAAYLAGQYSHNKLKLVILVYSGCMLIRAWLRAAIALCLFLGITITKNKRVALWVKRIHGSVITEQQLLKGKIKYTSRTHLDLSDDNFASEELAVAIRGGLIKAPSQLVFVDLHRCHLRDSEVCLIAEAFSRNSTLTSFDLSENCIGDEGAVALCNALRSNTVLCELNLSHNSVGAIGATIIEGMLASHNPPRLTVHLLGNASPLCDEVEQQQIRWRSRYLAETTAAREQERVAIALEATNPVPREGEEEDERQLEDNAAPVENELLVADPVELASPTLQHEAPAVDPPADIPDQTIPAEPCANPLDASRRVNAVGRLLVVDSTFSASVFCEVDDASSESDGPPKTPEKQSPQPAPLVAATPESGLAGSCSLSSSQRPPRRLPRLARSKDTRASSSEDEGRMQVGASVTSSPKLVSMLRSSLVRQEASTDSPMLRLPTVAHKYADLGS
eukprot:TRINITY_DN15780_c0_g1_i1.p1 TRINITY_DN15780_c0_g1~~TRINITY_DN15780_c0_g1_i1.p1  ORF type:complete len:677 (-),score=88.37 TRINITY_DN15780_c0_g1_i1:22-2052(-)